MRNTTTPVPQCIPCGIHWIIELSGCPFSVLNNKKFITETMNAVCDAGNFTRLETVDHAFAPHGVTMLSLLSESHISIHTWPEHGYAAIDIFTCGEPPSEEIFMPILREALKPIHCDIQKIQRGYRPVTSEK